MGKGKEDFECEAIHFDWLCRGHGLGACDWSGDISQQWWI